MNLWLGSIFDIVIGFTMLLIFFRFMLQFAEITEKNPYAKPAYQLTKIVDVFGRIFPTIGNGRISTSALVLMFILRLLFLWGSAGLIGKQYTPLELFFISSISLIIDFLRMCQYLIFASFIISWIVLFSNSLHPMLAIIAQLSNPIIAPFRKFIQPVGMFDLAPMIAFFVIILAKESIGIIASNILTM